MTNTTPLSFKGQLRQTLRFFRFKPSLDVSLLRVSATNKLMLFIFLAMIETVFHLIWYGSIIVFTSLSDIVHYAADYQPVFDRELIIKSAYLGLAMLLFCGWSMWFVTRIPEQSKRWLLYQGFFIWVYLIYEILFTIAIGDNSALEGVMLISATGIGMLLLRWRLVWLAFVTCVIALFIFNVSVETQWLKALPRLYPSIAVRGHWLWGLSFSFLVTAKATVTLYCIYQFIRVINFQRRKIYDLLEADALTNIANRRTIYSFLNYLWVYKNCWSTLSVIYLDLDKFKQINDKYGHDAGDATLVCTANTLKNICHQESMIGRLGGEEFCIILPDIGIEQAVTIAEQLRQAFEKQVVKYGMLEAQIQFTASMGIASIYQNHTDNEARHLDISEFTDFMRHYMHSMPTMPPLPPALERIMKFSEVAMQQAKANGRNCVVKGQRYLLVTQPDERQ